MRCTCIIPVYNCEAYIAEAIESVLSQTQKIDEIIVVDDGSTDGTVDKVRQFDSPVKYIHKEHTGLVGTVNLGLDHASGDYITFLDSDDIWSDDKLELQLSWLNEHQEDDMIFGLVTEFISPEIPEAEKAKLTAREAPMKGMSKGTMVARRKVFDTIGNFQSKSSMGDFIAWFGRAKDAGLKYSVLDKVLLQRRVHLHNYTRENKAEFKNYAHIMKEILDRKRAAQNK